MSSSKPDNSGISSELQESLLTQTQKTTDTYYIKSQNDLPVGRRSNTIDKLLSEAQKHLEDQPEVAFEDARTTRLFLGRIQNIEKGIVALGCMSLILSVIEYQLEFNYTGPLADGTDPLKPMMIKTLVVVMVINSFMAFGNFIRKIMLHRFEVIKGVRDPDQKFWNKQQILWFIIETALILSCPMPFLIGVRYTMFNVIIASNFYYNTNDLFHLIQIYKFFVVLRSYFSRSFFMTNRAYRVCQFYNADTNFMFVLKSLMKKSSLRVVSYMLLIGIILFAYALRIAEGPLNRNVRSMDHTKFINCCWEVIMVMTTVGFGDFYPRTKFGRIIIIFCCLYGLAVFSLIVVSITNILELEKNDSRALLVIEKLKLRDQITEKASDIVTNVGYILKDREIEKKKRAHLNNLVNKCNDFKELRRKHSNLVNEDTMEMIEKNFNDIKRDIEGITARISESIEKNKTNDFEEKYEQEKKLLEILAKKEAQRRKRIFTRRFKNLNIFGSRKSLFDLGSEPVEESEGGEEEWETSSEEDNNFPTAAGETFDDGSEMGDNTFNDATRY